jgi:hypothetical protein
LRCETADVFLVLRACLIIDAQPNHCAHCTRCYP